jgi:hypothetical protein
MSFDPILYILSKLRFDLGVDRIANQQTGLDADISDHVRHFNSLNNGVQYGLIRYVPMAKS